MARTLAKTVARGYGAKHKQRRAAAARLVASGRAVCARCHRQIHPGEPFDLDHSDDRAGYIGPSHVRCNRGAPSRREAAPRPAVDRFPGWPLPDPDAGNTVVSWSRHWSGPANPRCPACRELGGPCPDADPPDLAA